VLCQVPSVLCKSAFGVIAPESKIAEDGLGKAPLKVTIVLRVYECGANVRKSVTRQHDTSQRPRLGTEG
jgi:hypothetical protein